MKARVKATGEIVEVNLKQVNPIQQKYVNSETGVSYFRSELDFNVYEGSYPKDDPDYWTRLEHQYAGMAMQGMLSNPAFPEHSQDGYYKKNVVNNAYEYAHALVEKMKEKEERK